MSGKNIAGQRFGRLTARNRSAWDRYGRAIWLCDCDCGGLKEARIDNLTGGFTRSCGCLYGGDRQLPLSVPGVEEHW